MVWNASKAVVTLSCRLEENGVLTDCNIHTQDAEETLDFDFTSAKVVNKIIMQAECLREAFAELDMSSDVLEMHLSPAAPYFRLTTFGYAGTTQVTQSCLQRWYHIYHLERLLLLFVFVFLVFHLGTPSLSHL